MSHHSERISTLTRSRHNSGLGSESFKQAQLDFRQAEVEETVRVLRHINGGRGDNVFAMNPRREGRDLREWQGRLAMNNVTIGGHSFGATLAVCCNGFANAAANQGQLQTLREGPSHLLPFQSAVVLDP